MSSRAISSRRSSPSALPPRFSPEESFQLSVIGLLIAESWRPKSRMAVIGVLTLELRLENSHSLKDKRNVVQSLKNRLRHKFNVSVAEIDGQDLWQRATVAAVPVAASHQFAEKVLRSVEDEAAAVLGPELADATVEWL